MDNSQKDAHVTGSGAAAAGPNAQAVGAGGVLVGGNVGGGINTGTQIINNYLAGGQVRDPARLEQHVTSYLRWVRERCGHIELRGIERGGRKVLSLDLDKAYVPLEATVTAPKEERSGLLGLLDRLLQFRPGRKATPSEAALQEEGQLVKAAVGLDDALGLGNRLVVTGGPGCGKTTVLLHIAWALASAILDGSDLAKERLGLDRPLPVPIFIPLASYARHLRELKRQPNASADPRDRTLSAFVTRYLIGREHDFDLPPDFFVQVLRDGRAVMLLLDGLDEVSNEDEREVVRQAVEDLANGRPDMRVIVTCRTAAYKGHTALGGDFRDVVVTPLDDEHIRDMVGRFYQCIYPDQTNQAEASTKELMDGVAQLEKARSSQQRLIDSPLMVRMLLIVHYNDRRMPEQRAELYMKAAETMIQLDYLPDVEVQQELKIAVGNSWTDQYEMVQHLAFHMHHQGENQGREIDEDGLRGAFAETDYAGFAGALVDYTRNRGGLLEERLGMYRFIHLGFQEYLAARYLIEVIGGLGGVEAVARFFEDGPILESWWREPALLIPGYCAASSKSLLARNFLRRLAGLTRKPGLPPLSPEAQLAAAEIAGSAALDLREADEKLRADLAARLAELYQQAQVMAVAPPVRRAAAGVALSRLGDLRKGVGITLTPSPSPGGRGEAIPDIDWVPIPDDGEFIYGEGENLRKLRLPPYKISRYPITYAQFQAFVDAPDGFRDPRWWEGLAADEDHRRAPDEQRFKYANHPREDVSWYDAVAFCRWLSDKLGESVSLPTEQEWEKAARGRDGREYPWGNGYLAGYANINETMGDAGPTYLGMTSAVGAYPQGASPYGVMDMSGNVWEWCLNEGDNPAKCSA